MISTTYQVAVIDAFINFAPPPSPFVPYGINDAIEDQLYAKSTSSLILDRTTMYVFASDISGSKGNNIWYWKVGNTVSNHSFLPCSAVTTRTDPYLEAVV